MRRCNRRYCYSYIAIGYQANPLIWHINIYHCSSVVEDGFQSLAQINVGHRHCVPFSFTPLGPSGRGQIQNERPRFIPGFLVVKLMQGSWCPSHGGTGFLVKSFDQSSLLTIGSMTVSLSMSLLDLGVWVD